MRSSTLLTVALAGSVATAYQLPANLKAIYDKHKAGSCSKKLSSPFKGGSVYCADVPGAVFLKGNGDYDNMDIDCDGVNRSKGKCANDQSGQGQTRWKTEASAYGIPDLDANLHSYVVFGNEDHNPAFDPRKQGIEPLSVVAVVCGGQVFYGVWGDTNGGTTTGEASIALGDLCFPKENLSGNNGHDPRDVLYLAFPGKAAVPGKNGAKWTAKTAKEFQDSIKSLGDRLVASLK